MKGDERALVAKLKKILAISIVIMAIEFTGGLYANSIAIFSDGCHLLADVSAYIISLYALLKSTQPAPRNLTFGYEKVQPLGALINVAIIWVVTLELFLEATERIFTSSVVEEPLLMLTTSFFGLACKFYFMRMLRNDRHVPAHHGCAHDHTQHQHIELQSNRYREQGHGCQESEFNKHNHQEDCPGHKHGVHSHMEHQDRHGSPEHLKSDRCRHFDPPELVESGRKLSDDLLPGDSPYPSQPHRQFPSTTNRESARIHMLTDTVLSASVILSAAVIYFLAPEEHEWSYWQLADPLCTYLFSVAAIHSTFPIVRESLDFLLDGCTDEGLLADIRAALNRDETVQEVQSLRLWSANRGKHYGALRVSVRPGRSTTELRSIFSSRGVEGFVEVLPGRE